MITNLRRARHLIDVDNAEQLPLGLGDKGISRTDDLVDARNRLGPVRQRRHRLGAADDEHPITTPAMRAACSVSGDGPERDHHDLAHAGKPSRGTAVINTDEG